MRDSIEPELCTLSKTIRTAGYDKRTVLTRVVTHISAGDRQKKKVS